MHAFPRTFFPPQSRQARVTRAVVAPLPAATYIRLRREAAGLSIEDVARRICGHPRDLATATDLVRMLEQPGNVARSNDTLDRLQAAFPFDPAVYRQLATEPADRHPRVCVGCGCSQWDSDDAHTIPFAWAGPHACVRCTGEAGAETEQ